VASINFAAKEINCKIVYYGPGLGGKTSNLQVVHHRLPPTHRSEMLSLSTNSDRTIFFDFMPLDLGEIKGFKTRFQIYTVPGQVYYNQTRKLVLKGADGVVQVLDSQKNRESENRESMANLKENLELHGITQVPILLQYNKRDLPEIYTVAEMNALYNPEGLPFVEATALQGKGVLPTLKTMVKMVIEHLSRRQKSHPSRIAKVATTTQRATMPAKPTPTEADTPKPDSQLATPLKPQWNSPKEDGIATPDVSPFMNSLDVPEDQIELKPYIPSHKDGGEPREL
jgi:signal recognition particle receptor subunit beta